MGPRANAEQTKKAVFYFWQKVFVLDCGQLERIQVLSFCRENLEALVTLSAKFGNISTPGAWGCCRRVKKAKTGF